MLTRHLIPSAGDAKIAGWSILSAFDKGSTHLGVVTQNNSLWDLLSVEQVIKSL
jgi:ABC-type Na+ transport system ATPase subunit NatA